MSKMIIEKLQEEFSADVCILPEFIDDDQGNRCRYWEERPVQHQVQYVICHCMDAKDKEFVRKTFLDYGVSAHFLVTPSGQIICLVDPECVAYHSGPSAFHSLDKTPFSVRNGVNSTNKTLNFTSIGIEFLNPGYAHGGAHWYHFEPFSSQQVEVGVRLIQFLVREFHIPTDNILGHSDIAPFRRDTNGNPIFAKSDPGATFFWPALRDAGLSYPLPSKQSDSKPTILWVQETLMLIGYCLVPQSGELDTETIYVLIAFQLHFVPRKFEDEEYVATALDTKDASFILDAQTIGALEELKEYVHVNQSKS